MKSMSQLSPEEVRFQRQLVTRIKKQQIGYNKLVKQFYDDIGGFYLHPDEQKVLNEWQASGAIVVDGWHVSMHEVK